MAPHHIEKLALLPLAALFVAEPASAVPAAGKASSVCISTPGGVPRLDRNAVASHLLKKWKIGFTDLADEAIGQIEAASAVSRDGGATAPEYYSVIFRTILPDDQGKIKALSAGATRDTIIGYLSRGPAIQGVKFEPGFTWNALFQPSAPPAIPCDPNVVSKDPEFGGSASPSAPSTSAIVAVVNRLRVRGVPDQLTADRSADAFKGDTPATFSILRDGVAKTTNYKVIGAMGYAFLDNTTKNALGDQLIGYVNINYNDTKNFTGVSKAPQSNFYDVGLMYERFVSLQGTPSQGGVFISVRPDYLWDANDHSQLFTGDVVVTPRLRLTEGKDEFYLNAYRQLLPAALPKIYWEPVVLLKFDGGVYTKLGSNSLAAKNSSIARGGGQFGLNVVSDYPNWPLSFSTSYVYLYSWEAGKNIGYFSNSLTFSLDSKKYTGVTLMYNNGNLESTGKRQEQTTVGLSFKY